MATRKITTKKTKLTKPGGRAKKRKASVFGALPAPIREALSIAATEIFIEHIEEAVEDAAGLLEAGELLISYQGAGRGRVEPAAFAKSLGSLGAWAGPEALRDAFSEASADLSVSEFAGQLQERLVFLAAIELAEGILKTILGEPVPPRVLPYSEAIGVLAARLARAIENEDSSELDFNGEILGAG